MIQHASIVSGLIGAYNWVERNGMSTPDLPAGDHANGKHEKAQNISPQNKGAQEGKEASSSITEEDMFNR